VRRAATVLGLAAAAVATATPAGGDELLVFAATSLTDALQVIGRAFDRDTGHHTRFNFAGSNVLALQIQAGARADVFISADEDQLDALARRGLLRADTRRRLLSNRLVVVVRDGSDVVPRATADLAAAAFARIAIAEPHSVPAGKYARAYLQHAGQWSGLAPKLLPTENVRAALAAVEAGNADAAFVYRSDAATSTRVRVAFEIDTGPVAPISYPVAALRDGRSPAAADQFLAWVASPAASAVFERFGFIAVQP